MIDDEPTSSPSSDRRAGAAVAAWVIGAGILGGSWALHRIETSLHDEADKLAPVHQAQAHGATIDWDGRTANLDPGSLDSRATAEMVEAVAGLGGVGKVNVVHAEAVSATVSQVTTLDSEETNQPSTTTSIATTSTTEVTTTATAQQTTTTEVTTTTKPPTSDSADQLELLLAGRSIEFIFSTAVPTPETEVLLDELHDLLAANQELSLHITGHTDPAGNETANQNLSEARAQSIANHLIIRGIDAARMTTAGKGSSEPIADNATQEGQSRNRRVVIEAVLGDST